MKEIIKNNDMNKNLPLGAENDPRAPWNEKEPETVDFNSTVTIIISKKISFQIEEGLNRSDKNNSVIEELKKDFNIEEWEINDLDYEYK